MTCWYRGLSSNLSIPDFKIKKNYRNGQKQSTNYFKNNIPAWRQVPEPNGSNLSIPPISYRLPAAKQEPCRNSYLLMKSIQELSRKKSQKNRPVSRIKDKTERAMAVGRRRREEKVKPWQQMTALRFQIITIHTNIFVTNKHTHE